jgi:dynein regulatory complex protein 1
MLELLCDEAGFLVEDRVHSMIGSLPQEEQDLVKVDSILKSLGVETQAEVEAMLPYFTKAQHGEDPNRAPLISPEDTVRAIRAYVEDQQRQAARQASAVTMTMEEKAEKKRRDREREFWERLARVIPDQKARLWNALEDGLNKYNKLLTDRQNLLDETEGLRMQNDELRSLLNQYMSAKINEELYVPPILGGQNLYRH